LSSSSISADGRSDYLERLASIREDPKVKNLARSRAGDSALAEDALQEAYFAVARVEDPEHIEDLRAYYCRVLLRSIHQLRGQLGTGLVDDFRRVADNCQRKPGGEPAPPPFDGTVISNLFVQDCLRYLAAHRAAVSRKVPGRSPDPGRYRDVVVAGAKGMLLASVSDIDLNQTFRTAYPQWFAENGVPVSNIHQRFARARADACRLLRDIIKRRDLYS
jgi:DNA-directed RNA polymerase specialized sigma24 family protein